MKKRDLDEAIIALQQVLTALLATLRGPTGVEGAQLRYLCGKLWARGGPNIAPDLARCFDAARLAGSTFVAMNAVRVVAEAQGPVGQPAAYIKGWSVRLALAQQAKILAATEFTSRQDIDSYFDQINAAFNVAESVAANQLNNVAYSALIALHAAVSNDLANRARPLPRMVTYGFASRMPSLWLAQRIYYDPSRNDELIGENKPIHPLFMPPTGVALSA